MCGFGDQNGFDISLYWKQLPCCLFWHLPPHTAGSMVTGAPPINIFKYYNIFVFATMSECKRCIVAIVGMETVLN